MRTHILSCNGYNAQIMESDRLVGDGLHGLPPGESLLAYEVDSFVEKAPHWMTGEGSYVVKVKPNKGIWFDWRRNSSKVAVLPSIKGCNPITGQKIDGFALEQYKNNCPIHNVKFDHTMKCPECGYKWAPQNYISSPNVMWWDGFRSKDGEVRQFFFTEDMARDVASAMIGHENTVPAFGFAFYEYEKSEVTYRGGFSHQVMYNDDNMFTLHNNVCLNYSSQPDSLYLCSTAINSKSSASENKVVLKSASRGISVDAKPKEVAVGAGARIRQDLQRDNRDLDGYSSEPKAVIRIYFVFEDEFEKYASKGFISTKTQEGMLAGIPIG